jgi:hypothetical protein
LIDPDVKLIESVAIATFATLDQLHQTTQQAFDGALIHRPVYRPIGGVSVAARAGTAAVPTCL